MTTPLGTGTLNHTVRRYLVCWYSPDSSAQLHQRVVLAYDARDAVIQVEVTFGGMWPRPTRVHHVEPFPLGENEPEQGASG